MAFVGIAGVVAFTGISTRKEVEDKTIASIENAPKNWNTLESRAVVANSSLSGEVLDSKYVQFTTSITNSNSGDSLYITHLASYLTEDDKSGFIPLAANTLEYSYTPDDASSWTRMGVTAPDDKSDAFKLNTDLHLGTLGTATDTVYFRFYIEPEANTRYVNNKVSFLMRNSKGEMGYSASVATIAYENAILAKKQVAIEADTSTEMSGMAGEAYTDPLGMFSFIPGVDVASSVIASTTGIDQNVLEIGIVAAMTGVVIFIICLAAYIPIARRK